MAIKFGGDTSKSQEKFSALGGTRHMHTAIRYGDERRLALLPVKEELRRNAARGIAETSRTINNFVKPNENRNEITVTLPGSNVAVRAYSALNEWIRVAIRTPNGPLTDAQIDGGISSADVAAGRKLFKQAKCDSCHGGNQWTSAIRDFVPPPI